ncbi:MAG: hypothetical protein JKX97_07425 [Candidatus Lindowbacteria bacterium]|nr:hypothetical protein [Candidatus Lindowbacteria bacterium]
MVHRTQVDLTSDDFQTLENVTVASIGVFDGLHKGHRMLVETMKRERDKRNSSGHICMITFSDHPRGVLCGTPPTRLLHPEIKTAILKEWGVDVVVEMKTDTELLELSADEFCSRIKKIINPEMIIVGENFRFGKGRLGDTALLAQSTGAEVLPLKMVEGEDNQFVSATAVREYLAAGDVKTANGCLGRPYSVLGTKITGDKIGRKMGSSTINLEPTPDALPDGVYAVTANGHRAVSHLGPRPTFDSNERRFEVHILGTTELQSKDDNDVWEIEFHAYLRDVADFENTDELRAQIAKDIQAATDIFENEAQS